MDLRKPLDFILCKTFFRVKFEGRENVDFSKRYVFVANHVSAIDAMLIYTDIKDLGIMAKAELFKFKLFGKILSSQGVFPIERGKKDFGHVFNAVKIIKEKYKIPIIYIKAIPQRLKTIFNQSDLNLWENAHKNTKIGNANIKPPAGPVIWCKPPQRPEKTGAPTAPKRM